MSVYKALVNESLQIQSIKLQEYYAFKGNALHINA